MVQDIERLFSDRAQEMKASIIRELLKLTNRPGMISFAGGLPGPELFPTKIVKEISSTVLDRYDKSALQYSATEGIGPLREMLVEHMKKTSPCDISVDNLIVTTGSQQALDLLAKVFLNPGDVVVTGAPTYLGGINAMRAYQGCFRSARLDENGMIPEELEKTLDALEKEGKTPKFIYVIPTFQNPMGVTLPEERRKKIAEIAIERDLLIVEDSPYCEVKFTDKVYKDIYYYAPENTIYTSTFSKILAPGFRLAWMLGPKSIIDKVVMGKQGADLCTAAFPQYIAYEYMKKGHLDRHIQKIREGYGTKRKIMLDAMEKYFPKEVSWTKPQGGMFLWVTLPEGCNTVEMFKRALEKNVAFVIGSAFFIDEQEGLNTMRLNFTHATHAEIEEGIKRLGETVGEEISNKCCKPCGN